MLTCSACNGLGEVTIMVRPQGWLVSHNRRVRNYRGGPRPKVDDYRVSKQARCQKCNGAGLINEKDENQC